MVCLYYCCLFPLVIDVSVFISLLFYHNIDAYIQVHSENQVNFGATLRESIAKRVRDPRPGHGCFKEAEREAHRLLMQNAWPPFRDSPQFTMCAIIIRGLVPPPDRPRGGPSIHWQAVNAPSDLSSDDSSRLSARPSSHHRSSLPHVGEHDHSDDDTHTHTATGEKEEKEGADVVRSYEPAAPASHLRVVEA
jgi:hypothetical protein